MTDQAFYDPSTYLSRRIPGGFIVPVPALKRAARSRRRRARQIRQLIALGHFGTPVQAMASRTLVASEGQIPAAPRRGIRYLWSALMAGWRRILPARSA